MHLRVLQLRNRLAPIGLTAVLRPKPNKLIRLGSNYGGWWVPESVLQPGAVAYCAGAGEDITFDKALVERGLTVRTFDPTPRSIAYVKEHGPSSDRFQFIPVGWWDEPDTLRFYAPRDPAHVSHSALNLQGTSDYFEAAVEPPHNLAAKLGDDRVDIIKMDIEGAEYRVLQSLLSHGPWPSVLCIEFDQPQPLRKLLAATSQLQRAGYVLRKIDRWNYTFARR